MSKVSKHKQALGRMGEDLAAAYLQKKGYRLLERNYRCRLGEIDIIAVDGDILVFIEVRCRSSVQFGFPQESVRRFKQARVRKIAQYYLQGAGARLAKAGRMRFDVLALLFNRDNELYRIEHIQNAF